MDEGFQGALTDDVDLLQAPLEVGLALTQGIVRVLWRDQREMISEWTGEELR